MTEPTSAGAATTRTAFGGLGHARRVGLVTLLVAIGEDLLHLRVDRRDLGLAEISRLRLPAPVQYVAPHPTRSLLYAAGSNRPISAADDVHTLTTVAVDEVSGALRALRSVPLPTRPIHLTVTPDGGGVLVVYNAPASITWHPLDDDGLAGAAGVQARPPALASYPHQVRVLPSSEVAVVVARGNHATALRPEEPGALQFLDWRGGALAVVGAVAPDGGHGFGPRHLDLDPSGRWAAVSVERQNTVQVYGVDARGFTEHPVAEASTLVAGAAAAPASHDQLCGAIHFHPRGDRLYVANRHDPAVYGPAGQPCDPAGNDIALFAFDPTTGAIELLQRAPTDSVHVRTFSLDGSARLLAAASILPAAVAGPGGSVPVAARLSFFRLDEDGRLALARVHDMPVDGRSMFWSHLTGDF